MQTIDTDDPTIALACELIARESVTPQDAGCQQVMIDRLQKIGFSVERLRFDDVDNFWAVRGTNGPIFAFAGHTDVVPSGDAASWSTPAFTPTIQDNLLFGRGAADMKGSLAAMITACEDFVAENPNHLGRIAFLITSDEEGIAINGTVKVVEWLEARGEKIQWCLVGEPSSTNTVGDVIKNGRRGSLGCELRIIGKQGHVAYPHLASNPIHIAAPALAELASEKWDEGNAFFPATSFQISNINGGTGASNVIPGELKIVFNFRFSTELTADELKTRTENILKKHELNYDIQWHLSGEPFLTTAGDFVEAARQAIREICQIETELSTAGGTSDGRFIAPTGAQVVELGPVNASIHQVNEHTSCEELILLHKIYKNILHSLLGNK